MGDNYFYCGGWIFKYEDVEISMDIGIVYYQLVMIFDRCCVLMEWNYCEFLIYVYYDFCIFVLFILLLFSFEVVFCMLWLREG